MRKKSLLTWCLAVSLFIQQPLFATERGLNAQSIGVFGGLSTVIGGWSVGMSGVIADNQPLVWTGSGLVVGGLVVIVLARYVFSDLFNKEAYAAMRTDLLEYAQTGNLSLPAANYLDQIRKNVKEAEGMDNPTLVAALEEANLAYLIKEERNAPVSDQAVKADSERAHLQSFSGTSAISTR